MFAPPQKYKAITPAHLPRRTWSSILCVTLSYLTMTDDNFTSFAFFTHVTTFLLSLLLLLCLPCILIAAFSLFTNPFMAYMCDCYIIIYSTKSKTIDTLTAQTRHCMSALAHLCSPLILLPTSLLARSTSRPHSLARFATHSILCSLLPFILPDRRVPERDLQPDALLGRQGGRVLQDQHLLPSIHGCQATGEQ